jgi:hypothetical protein
MDKNTQDFKDRQKMLQNELQNYKDKKNTYKSYIQSMEDISAWLEKRDK